MRPEISEFSYGYALTEELINWHGLSLRAAPVFPSLIQEGRLGGGYDVRLDRPGLPLFLQFKLSHYMSRRNTGEYKKGIFLQPFYRFHLRSSRSFAQHNLLLNWENSGNEVYYVSPAFSETIELNDAYLNKQVAARSIFVRPSAIGHLTDEKEHYVSFQLNGAAYRFSEPMEVSIFNWDTFSKNIHTKLQREREKNKILTEDILNKIFDGIIAMVEKKIGKSMTQTLKRNDIFNASTVVDKIAYLAQTFLHCNFLIVTERNNT